MCSSYRRSKMEKRKGRCGRFLIMCRLEKARKIVLFGTDLLSFEVAEYFPMSRLQRIKKVSQTRKMVHNAKVYPTLTDVVLLEIFNFFSPDKMLSSSALSQVFPSFAPSQS